MRVSPLGVVEVLSALLSTALLSASLFGVILGCFLARVRDTPTVLVAGGAAAVLLLMLSIALRFTPMLEQFGN